MVRGHACSRVSRELACAHVFCRLDGSPTPPSTYAHGWPMALPRTRTSIESCHTHIHRLQPHLHIDPLLPHSHIDPLLPHSHIGPPLPHSKPLTPCVVATLPWPAHGCRLSSRVPARSVCVWEARGGHEQPQAASLKADLAYANRRKRLRTGLHHKQRARGGASPHAPQVRSRA